MVRVAALGGVGRGWPMPWLAYLRFDAKLAENDAALVLCPNEADVDEVLQHARAVFGPAFWQYATFISRGILRPKAMPNFPEKLVFHGSGAFKKAYPLATRQQPPGEGGGPPQLTDRRP
jgi:hypothetical protein